MAAREPTVFQALGHEEDPEWALGPERERGLARELPRVRAEAEQAYWEFAQDERVADESAGRSSPQ